MLVIGSRGSQLALWQANYIKDRLQARGVETRIDVIKTTGDRILDLACGPGRHAAELARGGGRVIGFDLSRAMLRRAHERTGGTAGLVRGDMRALPFHAGSFALAVNLFTSFGYFLDDDEHRRVVQQVVATLAPGGHFVLDYLNAEYVRRTLNVIAQTTSEDVLVTRRIDSANRFVIKEIELRAEGRRFQERVRLYGAEELVELLTDAGLRVTARFGNYDGAAAGPATPRVILVAARS